MDINEDEAVGGLEDVVALFRLVQYAEQEAKYLGLHFVQHILSMAVEEIKQTQQLETSSRTAQS